MAKDLLLGGILFIKRDGDLLPVPVLVLVLVSVLAVFEVLVVLVVLAVLAVLV